MTKSCRSLRRGDTLVADSVPGIMRIQSRGRPLVARTRLGRRLCAKIRREEERVTHNKTAWRSFRPIAWLLPLALLMATACEPLAAPTPTATPAPTPTPTPPPAPPTVTASPTPTPPKDALVPPGPFTPPPPGFDPTPPPPPDPAADDPDPWVRDYIELVTAMLNSDQSVQAVLDVLTTWAAPSEEARTEIEPFVWARAADLDGDGVDEWLLSLPIPGEDYAFMWLPTYLVIFDTDQDLFIPRSVIRGARAYAVTAHQPTLRMIEDITNDGQTEVLIEEAWCGAHTCFTGLTVGRWDGARWHDLAAEPIYQAYSDLTIADRDGDGALEFIMHGGTFGSLGAGLQRAHTWVFAWEDGTYRLVEDIPDPSDHPYYLMLDANTALAQDDWDRALELASQVVSDPDFDELMAPVEEVDKQRIVSYAAVQAMLVHAHRDDVAAMEAVLDQALSHGFVEPNIYSEAAQRMLHVYRETADPVQACSAMQDVVVERPDEAVFFQWYGYNTERITVDDICPLTDPTEDEPTQL